jgi:CHAT domain-containing protein
LSGDRQVNNDNPKTLAKDLYASLISQVESESWLNKSRQLCIVADKNLNFLPFAALVSDKSNRFFIEDYALEVTPSATVFITSSERATQKEKFRSERLLSIGDPHFDRAQFSDLPDLPAASREAETIASFYDTTLLLGEAAVTQRVTHELKDADVIHFATHSKPDERSPLLSRLLLTKNRNTEMSTHQTAHDGFLQASEIYEMKLPRARLVVLSACQTGIERAYRGEGAIGLARPFMAAGVPLIVASLWPVESAATADLLISFHKHRKLDHVSTVEALQRAQLEIINNQRPDSPMNYGWAAFVAIGGYATF